MMLLHISGSETFLTDTIHALPEGMALVPDKIWEIHKRATRVVFETDLDHQPNISDFAVLDASSTLSSLISSETFEATQKLWNEFNIQLPIETTKPWFAGLVLAVSLGAKIGFDPKFGADRKVWDATPPEKRFVLEGIEALSAFDCSPLQEQAAYLAMVAETPEFILNRIRNLFSYWKNNNSKGFEQELTNAKQQFPNMFSRLIDHRNLMWLPSITELIENKIPSLVLVGALHLVGENSLPYLLEQRGYRVSEI